jgi:hypothetical protein
MGKLVKTIKAALSALLTEELIIPRNAIISLNILRDLKTGAATAITDKKFPRIKDFKERCCFGV